MEKSPSREGRGGFGALGPTLRLSPGVRDGEDSRPSSSLPSPCAGRWGEPALQRVVPRLAGPALQLRARRGGEMPAAWCPSRRRGHCGDPRVPSEGLPSVPKGSSSRRLSGGWAEKARAAQAPSRSPSRHSGEVRPTAAPMVREQFRGRAGRCCAGGMSKGSEYLCCAPLDSVTASRENQCKPNFIITQYQNALCHVETVRFGISDFRW